MANYSREDAEKQGNAEIGAGVALLGGLAALLIGTAVTSSNEKKKQFGIQSRKQQIAMEVNQIDKQISDYKSRFLGSFTYSSEIAQLESKRRKLIEEYNKL